MKQNKILTLARITIIALFIITSSAGCSAGGAFIRLYDRGFESTLTKTIPAGSRLIVYVDISALNDTDGSLAQSMERSITRSLSSAYTVAVLSPETRSKVGRLPGKNPDSISGVLRQTGESADGIIFVETVGTPRNKCRQDHISERHEFCNYSMVLGRVVYRLSIKNLRNGNVWTAFSAAETHKIIASAIEMPSCADTDEVNRASTYSITGSIHRTFIPHTDNFESRYVAVETDPVGASPEKIEQVSILLMAAREVMLSGGNNGVQDLSDMKDKCEEVLKLTDGKSISALWNLGLVYWSGGYLSKAKEYFDKAKALGGIEFMSFQHEDRQDTMLDFENYSRHAANVQSGNPMDAYARTNPGSEFSASAGPRFTPNDHDWCREL